MKPSDILTIYGWIQGRYGGQDEGYCLMGAIQAAYKSEHRRQKIYHKLHEYIDGPLWTWNDATRRTLKQVLAVLRKAGL